MFELAKELKKHIETLLKAARGIESVMVRLAELRGAEVESEVAPIRQFITMVEELVAKL